MKTSFSSFTIENNLKEIEKALNAYGYEIEDKELKSKFEEVDKLLAVRESLTEAYEVGLLNVKYLSGESVNSSDYANAILKIERGDHDKLVKHYNYNLTKLYKAKNDLVGIVDDITLPSASMENYQSSLHGYNVSVEGIGDAFEKIGEKLKKAWQYIIEKMKKFFNWITGKSGEVDEAANAASSGNVTAENGGVSGAKIDMKGVTKKEDGSLEMSPEKYTEILNNCFTFAYNYLNKLQTDELTDKDLNAIVKGFDTIKVAEDLKKNIIAKCSATKKAVSINKDTKANETVNVAYTSKEKTIAYLQKVQKKETDTRSMFGKAYDGLSDFGSKVLNAGKGLINTGLGIIYKCGKTLGIGDGEKEKGVEAAPVEGTASDTGNANSCEEYLRKHLGTQFFTMHAMIKDPNINNADIKNISNALDAISNIVDVYYKGFGEALDRAIKEKESAMANKAEVGLKPAQASTNADNNTPDPKTNIKNKHDARKDLEVQVLVDEETSRKMKSIVGELLDSKNCISEAFNTRIQNGEVIIKNGKGDASTGNELSGKVVKCYGAQLDKIIVIDQPADAANTQIGALKAGELEFKTPEQKANAMYKEILGKTLSQIDEEVKAMGTSLGNLKKIEDSNINKYNKNVKVLEKMLKYSDTNAAKSKGLTISKQSANNMNRFVIGAFKLTSLLSAAGGGRAIQLASQLTAYMNYGNELGRRIADEEAKANSQALNEIQNLRNAITSEQ